MPRPQRSDATPLPRAFGTDPQDLAVPIDAVRSAEAVDQLLCACLGESCDTVQRWDVARRLDALIAIRQADGRDTESVALRCASCQAPFEIEIDLAACRLPLSDAAVAFESAGRTLKARLPTGAEQGRWQRERTPLRLVAASLLQSPEEPDEETLAALNDALATRDPLRELPLEPTCPECGVTGDDKLDLEAHLVDCFAQQQSAWLGEIATLAQAYHWSEAEIAAMPAWRRAFYLQQLDAQ